MQPGGGHTGRREAEKMGSSQQQGSHTEIPAQQEDSRATVSTLAQPLSYKAPTAKGEGPPTQGP